METTRCPNCLQEAGFDPSTGEVICEVCGVLEPPKYEPVRRPFVTCMVWHSVPSIMGSTKGKKPWHAPYLEMHLMGIERSMFYRDLLSTRYNKAVGIEWMYKSMGLVKFFSLN